MPHRQQAAHANSGAASRTLRSAAILLVLVAAPTPPAHTLASAWSENPESAVRLITPYRIAPRDGELWLGLHFRLAPHWHVYWKNSGDAGFPPAIDLSASPEVGAAELLWPAPERYDLPGDLVAFGYEDEVVYPVRARIAAGPAQSVAVVLTVDYLVCRVDCVPYSYTLAVDQPVGTESDPDPATAGLLAAWRDRLPRPIDAIEGIETGARLDLSELGRPVLEVSLEGARPAAGRRPQLFLEVHELFDPEPPALEESPAGLRFRVPLSLKRALDEPLRSSAFAWTVTGLAGSQPDGVLAVEARREVPASFEAAPSEAATGGVRSRSLVAPALAALAVGFLLSALWLWGVVGLGGGGRPGTEALGFVAAAAVLALLYALSARVSPEDLASIELALLGLGLAAWARSRAVRPAIRGAWSLLVLGAAAAAVWLAAVG
ncbi:MAG TPA: protein-disulfide reductase DsbD domain-containing protein [Thermoanaerobaculia bacterium]|nr:protein-disulfide reductase DsbD domain-containing protein [Thermoanaerobaculia bacterium]